MEIDSLVRALNSSQLAYREGQVYTQPGHPMIVQSYESSVTSYHQTITEVQRDSIEI